MRVTEGRQGPRNQTSFYVPASTPRGNVERVTLRKLSLPGPPCSRLHLGSEVEFGIRRLVDLFSRPLRIPQSRNEPPPGPSRAGKTRKRTRATTTWRTNDTENRYTSPKLGGLGLPNRAITHKLSLTHDQLTFAIPFSLSCRLPTYHASPRGKVHLRRPTCRSVHPVPKVSACVCSPSTIHVFCPFFLSPSHQQKKDPLYAFKDLTWCGCILGTLRSLPSRRALRSYTLEVRNTPNIKNGT